MIKLNKPQIEQKSIVDDCIDTMRECEKNRNYVNQKMKL